MSPELTVVTWNLQGRRGLDIGAVAHWLRERQPDVVALQEVRRRQLAALAAALGWSGEWHLKHWPAPQSAEGLGMLTRHEVSTSRVVVLRGSSRFSHRRRIALLTDVDVHGHAHRVVNVHLSAHADEPARRREVAALVEAVGDGRHPGSPALVAGDLNDIPGSTVIDDLRGHGWTDAWGAILGDRCDRGATNWEGSAERTLRPPTKRLDYVLCPVAYEVLAAAAADDHRELTRLAPLSDHLPVTATVRRRS